MDEMADDEIFLEARQINIGIYQNIIFSEWLPTVFGEANFAQIPELQLSSSGRKRRRVDEELGRRETPGLIKTYSKIHDLLRKSRASRRKRPSYSK